MRVQFVLMPGNPLTDPNWASEVTTQITTFVGKVRDTTTNKAVMAVRAVVFGLIAVIVLFAIVVLFLIMLTRLLQSLLQFFVSAPRSVYGSYFLVAFVFLVVGVILMKKRNASS